MNDPWDVKNVRIGHQYTSCMKINGVPLLPPVLSKECRKEMQYYKLLAIEVEKRIRALKPYIESDADSCDDRTDAPDFTDCDDPHYAAQIEEKAEATLDYVVEKFSSTENNETDQYNSKHSKLRDSDLIIDLDLEISEGGGTYRSLLVSPIPVEIPERDCDYIKRTEKRKNIKTDRQRIHKDLIDSIINNADIFSNKDDLISLKEDGPSSLSSKSFTGSLNDLHADVSKQSQGPKLIRQRSYTVLNPSPQLLAHIEEQSINTGVEVNSISMSESKLDNSPGTKRKSWDLESAKVKWSSMAMELKKNNIVPKSIGVTNNKLAKNVKSNSLSHDRQKRNSNTGGPKSEPSPKLKYSQNSVEKIYAAKGNSPGNPNVSKTTKSASPNKEDNNNSCVSKSDDPATRVKELYEKLQKQQLMQMANLMEKQKREQQILQQVFEEQNNILLKQLKTVCPKASVEVKQAWGDLKEDNDIGPVSLSQLINTSTPDPSVPNSPVAKTLTESASCLNKCDSMLQRSRDITNSLRKQTERPSNGIRSQTSNQVPITPTQGNSVKNAKNTSRKLNYDTTASSDAETIYTDRTNDTLADLNVTFPSDNSDSTSYSKMKDPRKIISNRACSPLSPKLKENGKRNTKDSIKNLEADIRNSMNTVSCSRSVTKQSIVYRKPTTKERVAATKIVACARGYLVRRLMRTERVQATVQTIRDALLCALQLHQDREGIRGADVDLHRRLIQQITAACYTLHDTFVTSTATERCAIISADRARRHALATKQPTPRRSLREDVMSRSHSGAFPTRGKRPATAPAMTLSSYETYTSDKPRQRFSMSTHRRVPWR